MTRENNSRLYKNIFNGSDQFYLADPTKLTIKKNGGKRWGVKKEFSLVLEDCIEGHLNGAVLTDSYGGTGIRGVVLPPIRKSDSKCIWAAIDVDGEVYNNDDIKIELLQKLEKLKLPLIPCYSKSKGLHFYIFFKEWTDAKIVRDILHTFLHKLDLPDDTECFPKQVELSEKDTGNGIMLPFMNGIGNDYIKSSNERKIITGTLSEFELAAGLNAVNADDIKIELSEKPQTEKNHILDDDPKGPTKWEILKSIKDGTIKQHPTIGGTYYSWIQIIICKCIKEGYGDNEILELCKKVHKDKINGADSEYTYPGSYQSQIDYTRKERQLNISNPGDTEFLKNQTIESAVKLDEITKSYCYVMSNDMFNKIGSGDFYQDKQINNYHKSDVFIQKGSLTNKMLSNPRFKRAETFITSAGHKPGLLHIDRPGIVPLINKGTVLNIYVPNYITAKKGDVKFIIEFFVWLVGEKKWKIIEQWIAFMIQYPGIKIKWAVVLVSLVEGVGKGLLARLISRILGAENVNENANYKHLTNTHNTLLIGAQLLVLNEVSLGDFKSKQEGTNTLKNFVADDIYSCNFKNKPMVKLPNLTNFMLFSNDERVVGAPQGGRRYFFNNISKTEKDIIQKTNEGFFDRGWKFVDSDEGAAALLYYFGKEVKIPDPTIFQKRAPETDDLLILIEQSKHPLQKKLEHDLTRHDTLKRKIFKASWCGLISFDELNEKLNTSVVDDLTREKYDWGSFGDDAILKFLSANAVRWNNGDNTRQIEINGVRNRLYNLDDSKCPISGKSYKDLTPKDIETIYKNYSDIKKAIENEETSYNDAILKEPEFEKEILDMIKNGHTYSKQYKNEDPQNVFEKLMNGDEKLGHNDQFKVGALIKYREKIDQGIRTPIEIVMSFSGSNHSFRPKKVINL